MKQMGNTEQDDRSPVATAPSFDLVLMFVLFTVLRKLFWYCTPKPVRRQRVVLQRSTASRAAND
jgi:hypothetical protein